jgi:hypothetical protein
MDADDVNRAVIVGVADSAVPRVDRARIIEEFGDERGPQLVETVEQLVREAASTHVEWGSKTLRQGVEEILEGMHRLHPELSADALHEIGRCVGWQLR